jgi:hypothetical protein
MSMRFEHKIFLASLVLCTAVSSLTAYSIYSAVKNRMVSDYKGRYQVLAATVGNTLAQLDIASDKFIRTSLYTVSESVQRSKKLPSNADLRRLRDAVGISSVDIVSE